MLKRNLNVNDFDIRQENGKVEENKKVIRYLVVRLILEKINLL